MPSNLSNKKYSISQTAQLLNLHPKTLRRWENTGKFTSKRTLGNQRRYSQKDINQLQQIKSGQSPTPPKQTQLFNLNQTAAKLGVSPATVQRWTKQGKFPPSTTKANISYYSMEQIKKLQSRQAPVLKSTSPPPPPPSPSLSPSESTPRQKLLKYLSLGSISLSICIVIFLFIQSRQNQIASPTVEQLEDLQSANMILPQVGSFLNGRITIGSDSGDLSFLDDKGNFYAKNTALIEEGIKSKTITFIPTVTPIQQIGRQYVDRSTGDLMYFDGANWISLNQTASGSAIMSLQDIYDTGNTTVIGENQDIDITLGNSVATGSATSLFLNLAGPASTFTIFGGASQSLITFNDDATYPVSITQPTKISANLHASKFIDSSNSEYFLDPANTDLSLVLAGNATISATLTFNANNQYITSNNDNYLTTSKGISVGGNTTYYFNSSGNINAYAGNFADNLVVEDDFEAKGQVTLGDGGETVTINNIAYTFPSTQTADYILQTDGSGNLSWTEAANTDLIHWYQTLGAIYPKNSTLDLLIGGQATASAKFSFINLNSGIPTLSFANATLLDLSTIDHDTTLPQGIKLPQADSPANISGGGEGYLAWDTDDNKLTVFDGSSWNQIDTGVSVGAWTLDGTNLYPDSTSYNIGIGMTAPLGKLNIQGAGTTTGFSFLTQNSSGAHKFAILDNGNVGIGTTDPTTKLHLLGAAGTASTIRIDNTTNGASLITQGMSGLELLANGMNNTTAQYTPALKFGSTDGQFLTTNPRFLAGIVGRATEVYGSTNSSGMALDFMTTADAQGDTPTPLVQMTIDQDGNVGIGTTTPSAKLEIAGASSTITNDSGDITIDSASDNISFAGDNLINITDISLSNYLYDSGDTVLNIDDDIQIEGNDILDGNGTILITFNEDNDYTMFNNGNVGINTLTPTELFDVNGNARIRGDLYLDGQSSSASTTDGTVYFDSDVDHLYVYGDPHGTGAAWSRIAVDMTKYSTTGPAVTNQDFIEIVHNQNTNDIGITGWFYDTVTSLWKKITDRFTTTEHNLDNEFNPEYNQKYKATQVATATTTHDETGTGKDGAITVDVNTDINVTSLISGRACADGGDAVNYSLTALTSTAATLSTSPSVGCLRQGDEVLIINLQGDGIFYYYPNVGNYETLIVKSVSGTTVNFTTPTVNYYGDGASDNVGIGTGVGDQRVMLQRIPNYADVTVNSSMNFYPSEYDDVKGGVMFFRASGAVTVTGTLHASYKGYIGGDTSGGGSHPGSEGGASFCGTGGAGGDDGVSEVGGEGAAGGGGGYILGVGGNGKCGGGGGSSGGGAGGPGSATEGGAGAGGGGYNGGAGGGGYGTPGEGGSPDNATYAAESGGTNTSGDGFLHSQFASGGGGGTYGDTDLTQLFFGSSGGRGGKHSSGTPGNGGDGGGIVYIAADTITITGAIYANGQNGSNSSSSAGDYSGGGGGGAGGSLRLIGNTLTLGADLISATHGNGGAGIVNGSWNNAAYGGDAGDGRIKVNYITSSTGTISSPATTPAQSSYYYPYSLFVSEEINTPGATSYANIAWTESTAPEGEIQFQTRTGSSTDSTDGTWEEWKPVIEGTNSLNIENTDTLGNWTLTATTSADPRSTTTWYKTNNAEPNKSNKTGDYGRIPAGLSGGDVNGVRGTTIINDEEEGIYKAWYSGDGASVDIYYATSSAGTTWHKRNNTDPGTCDSGAPCPYDDGRIGQGTNTKSDDLRLWTASVIEESDGSYSMWYTAYDGTDSRYRISRATSPDGLTWTKTDNLVETPSNTTGTNGRIPLGEGGSGDDYYTSAPSVIREGSSYKMWYMGYDGSNDRIFYATSDDGLTWTKVNNANPGTCDSGAPCPYGDGRIGLGSGSAGDASHAGWGLSVIKDGSTYKMWYAGYIAASGWIIYYAHSPDGLTWTKENNTAPGTCDTGETCGDGRIGVGSGGTGDDNVSLLYYGGNAVIKDGNDYKFYYTAHDGTDYDTFQATDSFTPSTLNEGDVIRNTNYFEDEDEYTAANSIKFSSGDISGDYIGTTIPASIDISSYNYITAWVRSDNTGKVAKLEIGETASTKQAQEITIDTANTWQKIYWDISDVASGDKDAITELRITALATNTDIYFDNIEAENLLSTPAGSSITSTFNNYIQYRTIFSNTTQLDNLQNISAVQIGYTSPSGSYTIDADSIRIDNDADYYSSSRLAITEATLDDTKSFRTNETLTSVQTLGDFNPGNGSDGPITVSSNVIINDVNLISGRSCPDGGDAVNYNVTALTDTTATLNNTPSSGCLAYGDEVLLINLQGTATGYINTGNYETLKISSITDNIVTFTTAKSKFYGDNSDDDSNLGVLPGTQRVMLQHIPHYTNVTVDSSYNFYPDEWDGLTKGGVMFFRASGTVSVNGIIHANSKGYDYGRGAANYNSWSGGGGSFCAPNYYSAVVGTGGDMGGYNAQVNPYNYHKCGGGAGGGGNGSGTVGTGSLGTSNLGGGGGGGGGGRDTNYGRGGGGAGGGYGTAGTKGKAWGYNGTDGGDGYSGNGGNGYWDGNYIGGGGGGGGGTYGTADLSKLMFGSGGGGGGGGMYNTSYGAGGAAGDGGGIIAIYANTITVSGDIKALGGNGANGWYSGSWGSAGGGGGAGGSIKLVGNTVNLGTDKVTAAGGTYGDLYYDGGTGGDGRTAVYYKDSYSGTTTETSYTADVDDYQYSIFISDEVHTPNATEYNKLRWLIDKDEQGLIEFQTRSGASDNSTDDSWEVWKPVVDGTNYLTVASGDTHTDWTSSTKSGSDTDYLVNWEKYDNTTPTASDTTSTNGRLPIGTSSTGDVTHAYVPSVVEVGSTYHMFYTGSNGTNRGYYATSSDGLIWTKENNTLPASTCDSGAACTDDDLRLPLGSAGKGDDLHVTVSTVLYDTDLNAYVIYYMGDSGTAPRYNIYRAISADGEYWTKTDNTTTPTASDTTSTNGIIPTGTSGSGDAQYIWGGASVIKEDDGTYKIWYAASDGGNTYRIYLAISPDGINWTKYDNSIPDASDTTGTNGRIPLGTSGTGDDTHVYFPSVIKDGSTYKMLYTGSDGTSNSQRIYFATSPDGYTWTKYDNTNPPLSDTLNTNGRIGIGSGGKGDDTTIYYGSAFIKDGDDYKIWYAASDNTNYQIYYATGDFTEVAVADGTVTRNVDFFEDEDESTAENTFKITSGSYNNGYAESTISNTDISDYDYLTTWVYATSSGNIIKLGFGESAATEQEQTFHINATNTWQKLYWDITDIEPEDRETITKLRVTISTVNTTIVHIDNIEAEKLLSDPDDSIISSTPNEYFQYRAILTSTDVAYRPTLYNVRVEWGNGFKLEQTDANTVRLYNFTGDTQELRLDAIVFGADLAEWYTVSDDSISAGDVVASTGLIDKFDVPILKKATASDSASLIGTISTRAGQELGLEASDRRLLALTGRVPIKMDPNSPSLRNGDYITASPDKPGLGYKALPGDTAIGKTFKNWISPSDDSITTVLSYIMQPSLTPLVNLVALEDFIFEKTNQYTYLVTGATTHQIIKPTVALASAVIGNVKAGLIDTTELLAETITIVNPNGKIISPTVETQVLTTDFISPLADNGSITVTGPVIIEPDIDSLSSSTSSGLALEVKGNASFSGKLTADKIVTNELIASSVKASTIEGLREKISNIVDSYRDDTATASAQSEEIVDISSLVADQIAMLDLSPDLSSAIASSSSDLDIQSVNASFGFFSEYLAVLGTATMTNLNITNSLNVNNSLILASNSISTLDNTLYLQPSGIGSINLLAGLMTLDDTGMVKIDGDLIVSGTVLAEEIQTATVSAQMVIASELSSFENNPFKINIASQSALSIYNKITNQEVASVNASGSAQFASLNLQSSGTALIPAGENHITVPTDNITPNSQVIITFTSSYTPASKYWVTKQPITKQFTIFTNYPVNNNTKVDWLIIN